MLVIGEKNIPMAVGLIHDHFSLKYHKVQSRNTVLKLHSVMIPLPHVRRPQRADMNLSTIFIARRIVEMNLSFGIL